MYEKGKGAAHLAISPVDPEKTCPDELHIDLNIGQVTAVDVM